MARPRVLRILNRLIIGGPAINATYLTKYLDPEFETMLVIGGKDDHEQDAVHLTERLGITPVVVPEMRRNINPINDSRAYQKVKAIIEDFKPDIVHTHAAKSGVIGRTAAEAAKVPVILHTFHGHVFHHYFSKWQTDTFIRIERFLAKKSTGIIAISESQRHDLSTVYKICDDEKIKIIPLGLDLDLIQTDQNAKRLMFRSMYGFEEDEIVIGIIGRIVPIKNHSLFVEAAARILAETDKKVKFLIVGDGDMRPNMEREFENHNIPYAYYPVDKKISTATCISWQENVDEVLAGLDIVVLTSHNEGTPLSLIEAQAASRPVVSTNVGGVSDIVMEGETGYITEPGDKESLAAALMRLVDNPELRKSFGRKGAIHATENFSYKRLVRDMSEYYHEQMERAKYKR
jgi:glycosyltransferase involved in cell wall biosynthesis